jgi:vacuolar-type H+-ATPase subunit C/Vma6
MFSWIGRSKRMRDALVTLYSTEYRKEYENLKKYHGLNEVELSKIIIERLKQDEASTKRN